MNCKQCGETTKICGCESTIPLPPPCEQGTPSCPDPEPCSETFSSACVIYQGDDLNCLDIHKDDTVESAIETMGKALSVLTCPTCTYVIDLVQVVTPAPVVTIDINSTVYSLGAYGNVANWGQILINLNSLNLGTWSYTVVGNIITLVVTGKETYNDLIVLQTPNVTVTPTCVDPLEPIANCPECFYTSQITMTPAEMRVGISELSGKAGKAFPITIPSGQAIEVVSGSLKFVFVGDIYDTPTNRLINLIHNIADGPQAFNSNSTVDESQSTFTRFRINDSPKLQVIVNSAIWLSFEACKGKPEALGYYSAYIMYRFITP